MVLTMPSDSPTKMGRPTACTPEVTADICRALSSGASLKLAAHYAGISYDSVARWVKRGDTGEEPYATFADQVRKAEAAVLIALSAVALKGAKDDPKLALRFLELHPRSDLGHSARHEISGPDGGPIATEHVARVVVLPPERDDGRPGGALVPEPRPPD